MTASSRRDRLRAARSIDSTASSTAIRSCPTTPAPSHARAEEILAIQSTGLARRMMAARVERMVIGVSGGLDSTLALLVAVEAVHAPRPTAEHILGVTMPGPGTTDRTRSSADELMAGLGVESRTIPIGPAVELHLRRHRPASRTLTT